MGEIFSFERTASLKLVSKTGLSLFCSCQFFKRKLIHQAGRNYAEFNF